MSRKFKNPSPTQGPRLQVPLNADLPPDQQYPVFSLRWLPNGEYGLATCTPQEKAAFAQQLYQLSQVTWGQIWCAPRHGVGCEKIAQNAIRTGIPRHVTPDVTLLVFRFDGLKPMVGYRDRAVFYILWLDRNFTLYQH